NMLIEFFSAPIIDFNQIGDIFITLSFDKRLIHNYPEQFLDLDVRIKQTILSCKGNKVDTIIQLNQNLDYKNHWVYEDTRITGIKCNNKHLLASGIKDNSLIFLELITIASSSSNSNSSCSININFNDRYLTSISPSSISLLEDKIIVAGTHGFTQATTGSVLSYGNAFIHEYNTQLALIKKLDIYGRKNSTIHSLNIYENILYFFSYLDRPLTHERKDAPSYVGIYKSEI
ncbi:MAG: hypothetical protein HQK53_14715, partial [Oligoflexia bacterium]|nr:hypothetical protein [Oligoflexia bacterium]